MSGPGQVGLQLSFDKGTANAQIKTWKAISEEVSNAIISFLSCIRFILAPEGTHGITWIEALFLFDHRTGQRMPGKTLGPYVNARDPAIIPPTTSKIISAFELVIKRY